MSNWATLFKKSLGKSDEEEKNEKTRMNVCAQIYQLVREIQEGLREFDPETRIGISTQNSDNNKRISIIVSINGKAMDTISTFILDEKDGWPTTYAGVKCSDIRSLRGLMENIVGDPNSKMIKTIIWAKMPPKEAETTKYVIDTKKALELQEGPKAKELTMSEKEEDDAEGTGSDEDK